MARARYVLVVEDDSDHRAIYRALLGHAGYRVLEASDGEAGVRSAKAHGPDLILMDVSLPGLDGWEATRRLKAEVSTASIPIVLLTAHAFPADRERAAEVGCDGFLAKPIEPSKVLEAVQSRIGVARPPS